MMSLLCNVNKCEVVTSTNHKLSKGLIISNYVEDNFINRCSREIIWKRL